MAFETGSAAWLLEDDREVVRLRDGSVVHLRKIRPDDTDRLRRMFFRLSPDTVYRRFLSPVHRPPASALRYLASVDHADREAIVALASGEIVGVARFDRVAPDAAEVAVVVEDARQGKGLGRILLDRISRAAAERGISHLTATMLSQNDVAVSMARSVPGTVFSSDGSQTRARIPIA